MDNDPYAVQHAEASRVGNLAIAAARAPAASSSAGSGPSQAVLDANRCGDGGSNKVLICHVPPGNPAAAHTLCISVNGLGGHGLAGSSGGNRSHTQDYVGACGSQGSTTGGSTGNNTDDLEDPTTTGTTGVTTSTDGPPPPPPPTTGTTGTVTSTDGPPPPPPPSTTGTSTSGPMDNE